MRAVVAESIGGPEVLRCVELPDPEPGEGRVRIAVEVAAITFMDVMRRSGSPIAPPSTFPMVLGNGVAGYVEQAQNKNWLGKRVVAPLNGSGGYASLAIANETDLQEVPEHRDLKTAAALIADGRTALGLHQAARIKPQDVVVVTAAAGGVGSLLVQLAKASGARVIGLAGSVEKLNHVMTDRKINYRDERLDERVDVVFDGVGAGLTPVLFQNVNPGGRYLPHGAAGGSFGRIDASEAERRQIEVIPLAKIGASPDSLKRALADQRLKPLIGQTYPLEQAAQAHRNIEQRTAIGKSLLLP